ncbi:MAG: alpha/beta fold hydrolase, partial [Anaerolineales bacterium]|nr:alpha/beta fold hydrolase [Anaerolineales bacterium]
MKNNPESLFKNPQLEGNSFLFEGGSIGILLIHGYTATTAEVRPLGHALHEAGYTVAGPLLPGHGTFPEDANRYSWKDWAASAENAYQDLQSRCSTVIVGGESTGGLLALLLAANHPEIAAIITYAPALKLSIPLSKKYLLIFASPFVPFIKKRKKDDDLPWQGYIVYPLKGAFQLILLEKQVHKNLRKIHQPLLIIQGKLDRTVHPDTPKIIARSIQSEVVEVHWMKESGHCVALDKELDQVVELTKIFLR